MIGQVSTVQVLHQIYIHPEGKPLMEGCVTAEQFQFKSDVEDWFSSWILPEKALKVSGESLNLTGESWRPVWIMGSALSVNVFGDICFT